MTKITGRAFSKCDQAKQKLYACIPIYKLKAATSLHINIQEAEHVYVSAEQKSTSTKPHTSHIFSVQAYLHEYNLCHMINTCLVQAATTDGH